MNPVGTIRPLRPLYELMMNYAPSSPATAHTSQAPTDNQGREPLLREALGGALRDVRNRNGLTLRELSQVASVSPGYLSELERGRKEVSSELLASVCGGLGLSVADVLMEAAAAMALHAVQPEMASMEHESPRPELANV